MADKLLVSADPLGGHGEAPPPEARGSAATAAPGDAAFDGSASIVGGNASGAAGRAGCSSSARMHADGARGWTNSYAARRVHTRKRARALNAAAAIGGSFGSSVADMRLPTGGSSDTAPKIGPS